MRYSAKQNGEFFELLELLREQRITAPQLKELEQIVLNDPSAMEAYIRYMAVAASLRHRLQDLQALPSVVDRPSNTSLGPRDSNSRRQLHWAVGTVVFTMCVLMAVFVLSKGRTAAAGFVGTLDGIQGEVFLARGSVAPRPAPPGARIMSGDTLRTYGLQGLATLVTPGGAQLMLVGNSSVRFEFKDRMRLIVGHGVVAAKVEPLPSDSPIELITAEGTTRILGTQLCLQAAPNHTELSVTEGRVQFTRKRDGRSVEVTPGKRVVDGRRFDLVVSNIPETTSDWRIDFENGLPEEWKLGRSVSEHLPNGSKCAVGSTNDPQTDGSFYGIVTSHDWMRGLFTVQENSCLNLTYKFDQPGWVQIFMGTREAQLASATGATVYLLEPWEAAESERWWNVPAGKWHNASIPLSKFFNVKDRRKRPTLGEVCFGFTFSSQSMDRKLVIDQIWVTANGPPSVEVEAVP